jgi:peptidoglycan/xylan/chitin deacetylase (PgdA/CDA1 family)
MVSIPAARRRELKPYLAFLRRLDDDVSLDTRLFHVLYEFTEADFERVGELLADEGVHAGFSVPGRRIEQREGVESAVAALADAGHDIVLHGHRHTSFMDTSYETAHDELSRAVETIERVTGEAPTGFHVPYMLASDGTMRAATDLGVEWVVGRPETDEPDVPTAEPVSPYDLQLLESGSGPTETFEHITRNLDDNTLVLTHPNIHLYHDATAAFEAWLEAQTPEPPAAAVTGTAAVGLLCDCFSPFRLR